MDIIKEINRLPNFGYVFWGDDGREHLAILGGHTSPKTDTYEWAENILNLSYSMNKLYSKAELSDDDKTELARLMQKMYSFCESRKEGLHSLSEQEDYLSSRSEAELQQIEHQLKMHLECRAFFSKYIY